jgi:hypothetical protein
MIGVTTKFHSTKLKGSSFEIKLFQMKIRKSKAAFVVGAGAVENAWAPVLRALQPNVDFPLTVPLLPCKSNLHASLVRIHTGR